GLPDKSAKTELSRSGPDYRSAERDIHVAASMAHPEAGLGRHFHARDPDPLGSPESRFCLDVRGTAVIRVSCPGDVVLSALAVRPWSSTDAVHLERLFAAPDVPTRHRPRDLRGSRQRCDAVSPCCHAARPYRRTLR